SSMRSATHGCMGIGVANPMAKGLQPEAAPHRAAAPTRNSQVRKRFMRLSPKGPTDGPKARPPCPEARCHLTVQYRRGIWQTLAVRLKMTKMPLDPAGAAHALMAKGTWP